MIAAETARVVCTDTTSWRDLNLQMIDWPDDTKEIIETMRANGYTWQEIGLYFGCNQNTANQKYRELLAGSPVNKEKSHRFFTEEEDAEIRRAYLAHENLYVVAAKMGRRRGDLIQRINHKHRDLLNTVRTTSGSMALNKYGRDTLLAFDPDYAVAAKKLKEARELAKAKGRAAAIAAKEAKINYAITQANEKIANGMERNEAIFELRAMGISLEKIGVNFGITRERVRQIFDAVAVKKAYSSITEHKDVSP